MPTLSSFTKHIASTLSHIPRHDKSHASTTLQYYPTILTNKSAFTPCYRSTLSRLFTSWPAILRSQDSSHLRQPGSKEEAFSGQSNFSQPSSQKVSKGIGEARPREQWKIQKEALKKKFAGQAWAPRKKLSPDALEGIRDLHAQDPDKHSTPALADQFQVSPESIRRILRSKWVPTDPERTDRQRRWEKRGEAIWSQMAELGTKPPKKWRQKGIADPRHTKRKSSPSAISVAAHSLSANHGHPVSVSISNRIL